MVYTGLSTHQGAEAVLINKTPTDDENFLPCSKANELKSSYGMYTITPFTVRRANSAVKHNISLIYNVKILASPCLSCPMMF
jgi:hypothetical protein